MSAIPVTSYLDPIEQASADALQEALRLARSIESLTQNEAWPDFLHLLERKQRQEMKHMMRALPSEHNAQKERALGQAQAYDEIPKMIEGAIRRGEDAKRQLEQRGA